MGNNVSRVNEQAAAWISLVLLALLLAMLAGYANRPEFRYIVEAADPQPAPPPVVAAMEDPKGHAEQYRKRLVDERFEQALMMYHAKRYDYAIKALDRVIELAPNMAEAYLNKGYALLGLELYREANDYFNIAIDMRPYLANAYWGLALAAEKMDELDVALGAMRTYIHLSPPNDPLLRKARSALWEWESALKRGPLPEAEQEWIDRRSKEWVDRNGPEADNGVDDRSEGEIELR